MNAAVKAEVKGLMVCGPFNIFKKENELHGANILAYTSVSATKSDID